MTGNPDQFGGDAPAVTEPSSVQTDQQAPDTETESAPGDEERNGTVPTRTTRRRRPKPLTVVAVFAVTLFALWGIGGPLVGTSSLSPTNEMVTSGPFRDAGYAGTTVTNTFLDDTYTSELPSELLFKNELADGNVAQWNPYISGGTPLGSLPNYALYSPLTIPFYVLPDWLAPAYERLLEIICAVGGCYLFLRRLRICKAAAITAGMVFATSGFMVAWLGFPQTRVAAFIPVLFWVLERFIQQRRVRDAALIAIPVAAMLLGGFPSVTGYALLTAVAYGLVRVISQHRGDVRRVLTTLAGGGAGILAGVLLSLFQMLPFLGFYKSWLIEGRSQMSSEHLPLASLLTSVAPWAFGTVDPNRYQPYVLLPNFVESVSYVSAAAAVLALVALAMPQRGRAMLPKAVWVFFAVTALVWGELIYIGGPPLALLQHTPILRALFASNYIGRSRSVFGFMVAVLVGVGFEALLRTHAAKTGPVRARRIWAGVVGVVGLGLIGFLVWIGRRDVRTLGAHLGQNVGKALYTYRNELLVAAALIVVAIACVVVLRYTGGPDPKWGSPGLRRKVRFGAAALLPLLIAVQSAAFVLDYYPHSNKTDFYPVTDTHTFLGDNLGHERYASTYYGMVFGTNSGYELRAVNGHTFINTSFAAMIRGIPDNPINYPTYIDFSPVTAQATSPILDLLGTKYFVASPIDPVLGNLTSVTPDTTTTTLVPGRPVTVPVPATGPLRAVGITPSGPVANALFVADPNSYLDVVIRDASGSTVTETKRMTTGLAAGKLYELPVAADTVPAGARLTATLTLHSTAPLRLGDIGGTVALSTVDGPKDGLRLVNVGSTVIYQRLDAQPRIRWAADSTVVPDQGKRVQLLSSGTLPTDTVVLDQPGPATGGKAASVRVNQDGTDTISTTVDAQGAGYLVVADADQVGWSATVDGQKAPLVPADEGVVAIPVPAGRHAVALSYDLPHTGLGNWVSGVTAVLLVVAVLAESWWWRRKRRERFESDIDTV
jgi:Bacterial membrane protein YfhO